MKKIACVGTGTIGSAWGAVFLKGGHDVTLYDLDDEKLEDAKQRLNGMLQFYKSQGLMDDDDLLKIRDLVHYTTNMGEAVSEADLIQENAPENVEIKQSVIEEIEKYCKDEAIIASSTSGLLISDIAAKAIHPERILGGHPYNPVHIMPLVEISKGKDTNDEYAIKLKQFYKSLNKEPVVLNKECPGFICNRLQVAVAREAYDLVMRGICSVEDVDTAVVYGVGLRWAILGPHLVSHLGGGAGGFRGINEHLAKATSVWLNDMAKWTDYPMEYNDIAEIGIKEEMANREVGKGQTVAELGAYLNNGVIDILKYHGKL